MLSALQVLTFFLPIGSEDRISQSTTILLSVVVFQSIVVGELPRTSNSIPLLCLYIDFLTGISVVTVADAILGMQPYCGHQCKFTFFHFRCICLEQGQPSRMYCQAVPVCAFSAAPERCDNGAENGAEEACSKGTGCCPASDNSKPYRGRRRRPRTAANFAASASSSQPTRPLCHRFWRSGGAFR